MANIDVLEEALSFITDHPEQHQQAYWNCESGACFAGHIALLNGYRPAYSVISETVIDGLVLGPDETSYRTPHLAASLAGLTDVESELLFVAGNTRDEIALMIKDMRNGEDITKTWEATRFHDDTGWRYASRRVEDDEL